MNTKTPRRIALALLLTAALAACTSNPTVPKGELLQRIESASTPADHEALAAHYVREAAAARALADEHRKMESSYQRRPAGERGGASMRAHCNAIVRSQESIAVDYDGMAEAHRQLARQTRP